MNAIEALTKRVSAGPLTEPAPDDAALHQILAAAARAPDHGRLRPWRFVIIRGPARERFGELLARCLHKRMPEIQPAQLEREKMKPMRAPLIIAVCAKIHREAHIPEIEQVLSAGAAAQNIMLATYALGYGCAWKTGDAAYDPEVKTALGLAPDDAIVGFLYLGTNAKPLPAPAPVNMQDHVAEWSRVAEPALSQ
ncbi:MAG TPA: nitroreductase [Casimicrobiaceae bacterium]|nr:nitroreductase [Casimicrobiaceae bacterium]